MTETLTLQTPESLSPAAAFEHLATEGVFDDPAWLLPLRRAAIASFARQGYPNTRHEDWRFTNVSAVAALPFRSVARQEPSGVRREEILPFLIPGLEGHCLVFINGQFSRELSTVLSERGVIVASLADRLAEGDLEVRQKLGQIAGSEVDPFVALNTAFLHDGAYVQVEPGMVSSPVHLLFINDGEREGSAVHLRNLIRGGRNSHLTLIESYVSIGSRPVVTNSVTEVSMDESAVFEHIKLQDESDRTYHLAAVSSELERSAHHKYHSIALGAKLSRTRIHANLDGHRVVSELSGLYLVGSDRLADHHMIVEHARPECESHEYFHGILAGTARGVFHGRIRVHPGAQKTDAKQTNRNLLLSTDATINTQPQLEIYADDVKCTHGATVGQLNEASIFYMRSRGIGPDQARRMLVHAFAGEIIARVQCEPIREYLDKMIWDRIEDIPELNTVESSSP